MPDSNGGNVVDMDPDLTQGVPFDSHLDETDLQSSVPKNST